jgi:hypothetical protein
MLLSCSDFLARLALTMMTLVTLHFLSQKKAVVWYVPEQTVYKQKLVIFFSDVSHNRKRRKVTNAAVHGHPAGEVMSPWSDGLAVERKKSAKM